MKHTEMNAKKRGKSLLKVNFLHRHLSNKDCTMAHTACLVCFISTVNGRSKKEEEEEEA